MRAALAETPSGPVFYWNVDGAVGLNGTNHFDDVLFVQWCVFKIANWQQRPTKLRDALKDVPINGTCTGRADDPLVALIKVLQQDQNLFVDGRVSPATGSTYARGGTRHYFLIHYLNHVLRALHPEHYPRIDLMPQFVWRIKDKAIAPFLEK